MTDTNDTAPESNTTGPESADAPLHRRGIKSYVIRAGRMTQAQQRGLEDVWPRLGLTIADGRQDLDALFGRQAPRVVEIGFGMGNSLSKALSQNRKRVFCALGIARSLENRRWNPAGKALDVAFHKFIMTQASAWFPYGSAKQIGRGLQPLRVKWRLRR